MECRQMEPIVYGLRDKYSHCMSMERVNFHAATAWHELLSPLGSPEFVLLDSARNVIQRWFGITEEQQFAAVLDPLCSD